MSNKVGDSKSTTDQQKKESSLDSVKDQCFFVRWMNLHSFIHFGRSICRPLAKSDLFNLDQEYYPQKNSEKYREQTTQNPQLTIIQILFKKLIIWQFLWAGLLAIIGAGLAFSGPLVIKQIMNYIKLKKTPTDQQTRQAYTYVGIWIVLYFVRIFVNEYSDRLMFCQAIKTQEILQIQVFNKILRLSPSYKIHLKKGELMKYLTTDIKSAFNFIRSCMTLFSAPATLIVVQAFIFRDNGFYGFSLLGVLVVTACLQVILNKKMSSVQKSKLEIMNNRISTNIELLNSMKQIKLLGWQSFVIEKNAIYRKKQNNKNKSYMTYGNLYDLVINLTPTFSVFLIFVLQLIVNGTNSLDNTTVFSTLAFAGMTYSPTKSLLITIVNAINGSAALERINNFLKVQQIAEVYLQSPQLKKGAIQIAGLVACWQSYEKKNQKYFQQVDAQSQVQINMKKTYHEPMTASPEKKSDSLELIPNKSLQLINKISSVNFLLRIGQQPLRIQPGQRVILLSESDGGKSTFFHALLGNLNLLSGDLKINGKIGFLPNQQWFKRGTIRDNVTFGLPLDMKKLHHIYKMTLLDQDLKYLGKYDQYLIKNNSNLTDSQKRKISLCRTLYSDPDILLLDSVFSSFDQLTTKQIYSNLCNFYKKKTILIITYQTDFIMPQDRVILFEKGTIVQTETRTFGQKIADKNSKIHKLIQSLQEEAQEKQAIFLEQKQILEQQKLQRKIALQKRKKKLRLLINQLSELGKNLTKQQIIAQIIKPAQEAAQAKKIQTKTETKRIDGISIKMYMNFFKSSSVILYLLLFFLSLLTQTTKIFSDWWIGSIKTLPWQLGNTVPLYIYIGLTISFGIFFALAGFLSPSISIMNTETILNELNRALTYKQFTWYQGQNPIKIASKLNRDFQQMFIINNSIQNIFKNILLFLGTIILVGYATPQFFAFAAIVLPINLAILLLFMRTQRQIAQYGIQINDGLSNIFDDAINGAEIFRAYGRVQDYKKSLLKQSYLVALYKMNHKFIYHGMSIACQLASLLLIAGIAFFAVASKTLPDFTPQDIAIIGTSISLAVKMTGISTSIVKDCLNLELLVKFAVKGAYDLIGNNMQKNYDKPIPPQGWPITNTVQFKNVSVKYQELKDLLIKDLSLKIQAGQNVVVCGKDNSGSKFVLGTICKLFVPCENEDASKGSVMIGGQDIQHIGRKFISRKVMLLNNSPFLFTGTVRQNMDPFRLYSDQLIKNSLISVGLWDQIKIDPIRQQNLIQGDDEDNSLLSHTLFDAGSQFSLGLRQKFNIARALLYAPQVLLCDSATSSLDQKAEKNIEAQMKKNLIKTTRISITQNTDSTIYSDKIIYMSKGVMKQFGKPIDLLRTRNSRFGHMVQQAKPELYQKLLLKQRVRTKKSLQPIRV